MVTPAVRRSQLRGLDYRSAELFGKPHVGAFYERDDSKTNRLLEGSRCVVCGRQATNSHHVVPLGKARSWDLHTERGIFVLKSPLFAVCGSGTMGCHDGFHGGALYTVRWIWDRLEFLERWWSGWTLAHGFDSNDQRLFEQGCYEVTDRKSGHEWKVRG